MLTRTSCWHQNQKFRFGLACPDLARPKRNFSFDVNGRFESTWCVTMYSPGERQIESVFPQRIRTRLQRTRELSSGSQITQFNSKCKMSSTQQCNCQLSKAVWLWNSLSIHTCVLLASEFEGRSETHSILDRLVKWKMETEMEPITCLF